MKMVFDVESNGIHGEGFAVGWVVEHAGQVVSEGYAACALGEYDPWVAENVIPLLTFTHDSLLGVRDVFWQAWLLAKSQGATLWADCCWPVEANFLSACVADSPESRAWEGPYPLYEIATVFELAGIDPTVTQDRLPNEPVHHPLGDARQSARKLQEALNGVRHA